MRILDYSRIMIVGNNGSGKSVLAVELGIITGLPIIHLDNEFWRPNWETPSKEEWHDKNIELAAQEKWIIDGNVDFGGTMELRFNMADLIIFLDISRLVCLAGVIKRNGKKRADTPEYHYKKEAFDKKFLGFCKGIWNYSKNRKIDLLNLHNKYPEKTFVVIKSRNKLKKLLIQWKNENK